MAPVILWGLQSSCGSSLQYLSFACSSNIGRSRLQSPVSALLFMAPVSCICCSSLQFWLCRSCLQYLSSRCSCGSSLLYVSPIPLSVVARGCSSGCRLWLHALVSSIVRGTSICRLLVAPGCRSWLQYLSLVAPAVSVVACGSSVSCRHGSGISCRSWLQYLALVAPPAVAPVSVVVHGSGTSSSIGFVVRGSGSSSVAPVLALSFVVPVSSISCRSWLHQYLSFVTPVSSPVASGSIGYRLWLR